MEMVQDDIVEERAADRSGVPEDTEGRTGAHGEMQARHRHIRNVAVIAHVDHGKTTLVDGMLRQSGLFREGAELVDRVMDNIDLERERGITILAKNTAIQYGKTTINILDTPGHHDFGGEVERTLVMADGVLLLVDAAEGPLPQTRFVVQKALDLGLPAIVVINKIDRKDARAEEVLNEVYDLFIDLGASDEAIEFPVLYTVARDGVAHWELGDDSSDLKPLFDAIVEYVPAPADPVDAPLQLHVNNLGWDDYVGRLVIGRIRAGTIRAGQEVFVQAESGVVGPVKVMRLYRFLGLKRTEVDQAWAGDIVAVAGIAEVAIGDTITARQETKPLSRVRVDEPTLAMNFCVNTSPFAGKEGRYVTSRQIRERLLKESVANVAIRVEETDSPDVFRVVGRGELQLGIFVETMRREGYEFQVGKPHVIFKEIDGKKHEPMEILVIDVPEEVASRAIDLVTQRKGELKVMEPKGDQIHLEFSIPSRGIIGLRNNLLTATAGEAVIAHRFDGYGPYRGDIRTRNNGSLVSLETGQVLAYALDKLQDRGRFFIVPGDKVYKGQVVGEYTRDTDLEVNVLKGKKLTNMRAAGSDQAVKIAPPVRFSLEEAMEYIRDDEYLEVTPASLRMRKIPRQNVFAKN